MKRPLKNPEVWVQARRHPQTPEKQAVPDVPQDTQSRGHIQAWERGLRGQVEGAFRAAGARVWRDDGYAGLPAGRGRT